MSEALERPPGPGRIRPFDFPEVVGREMEGGPALRLVRLPRLPVVSVSAVLNAGESWLGRDRAGLAVLTGDALEGGTERRSGPELAEALEGLGADLSISTGWDSTAIGLSCLADRLDEALPVLAEVILEPSFPSNEVERLRNQQLASLEERRKQPRKIAADAAVRHIFAGAVPYARPLSGLEEVIAAASPADLERFAGEAYRSGDAGLVVAGDVEPSELEDRVRGVFGAWGGAGRGWPELECRPRSRERRIVVVDRPGSVQSEIRIGQVGIDRASDDYFPLLVLNTLLGGTFTSRLNQTLREEKGYTYGVRSRFSARRYPGPFQISTAVETEVTADAVDTAVREVETLLEDGPTTEEVEAARDYIVGVFPLRFETTSQTTARLAELLVYDLPDDWHARYRDRVRQVTRAEAHAAGRRRIQPEEFVVVVVGDAEAIRAPLEALALGPVVVEEAP